MKDRWMNVGHEDDELKPYVEPLPDYKDPRRTGEAVLGSEVEPAWDSDPGSPPLSQTSGISGIVASLVPFAQPVLLLVSNSFICTFVFSSLLQEAPKNSAILDLTTFFYFSSHSLNFGTNTEFPTFHRSYS